jgi:hypothetical protein
VRALQGQSGGSRRVAPPGQHREVA